MLENKTESVFQEFQQLDGVDEVAKVDELNSCQSSEPEMGDNAKGQAGYLNTVEHSDGNFGEGEINITNVKTNSFNTGSPGSEANMLPIYSFSFFGFIKTTFN